MISKQEVESAIAGKDDFIKIDYLNRYLKRADSLEMKRFLLLHLAAANENKGLLNDAIRNVSAAGDVSITFREKRDLYMKEVALWIKIGDFMMAEKAFHKALGYGSEIEKVDMQNLYEDSFRAIGKSYMDGDKLRKALEIYEKLFAITKVNRRKMEVKEKLLELYEKLGRGREYDRLKNVVF
ncbi:hypothetical protein CMI46_02785 [Candidatus Pacearchaeota archaeon]|nr:hypothetical protein [Candidatus Pacearchaeota archaeon]